MDEWPAVRKKMPWSDATFQILKPLDGGGKSSAGDPADIPTEVHRQVYKLSAEGRTAEKVAHVSRLGEFEAFKALIELQDWGYLKVLPPERGTKAAVKGLAEGGRRLARSGAIFRLGFSAAFFFATLYLVL